MSFGLRKRLEVDRNGESMRDCLVNPVLSVNEYLYLYGNTGVGVTPTHFRISGCDPSGTLELYSNTLKWDAYISTTDGVINYIMPYSDPKEDLSIIPHLPFMHKVTSRYYWSYYEKQVANIFLDNYGISLDVVTIVPNSIVFDECDEFCAIEYVIMFGPYKTVVCLDPRADTLTFSDPFYNMDGDVFYSMKELLDNARSLFSDT